MDHPGPCVLSNSAPDALRRGSSRPASSRCPASRGHGCRSWLSSRAARASRPRPDRRFCRRTRSTPESFSASPSLRGLMLPSRSLCGSALRRDGSSCGDIACVLRALPCGSMMASSCDARQVPSRRLGAGHSPACLAAASPPACTAAAFMPSCWTGREGAGESSQFRENSISSIAARTCAPPAIAAGGGILGADGAGAPHAAPLMTGTRYAEFAIDADYPLFLKNGSSAQATLQDVEMITAAVNAIFERDAFVSHRITGVVVRSNGDPYTTNDASQLLSQFRSDWERQVQPDPTRPRASVHRAQPEQRCRRRGLCRSALRHGPLRAVGNPLHESLALPRRGDRPRARSQLGLGDTARVRAATSCAPSSVAAAKT
jgi:hypothetical protein